MSRDRFAFIIVYLALAGFTPSYSWAAKSNSLSPGVINEQTLLGNDPASDSRQELTNSAFQDALKQKAMQRGLARQSIARVPRVEAKDLSACTVEGRGYIRLKPLSHDLKVISAEVSFRSPSDKRLNQEAIAQANSPNPEPPQKINRLWFFGGMAATSSIALFLTWILFSKPPQQEEDPASELTAISPVNQPSRLNKAKVKTLSGETPKNQGTKNGIVTQFDVNSGADAFTHNALRVKKSLVQSEISQIDSPIADIDADIDVVQELINDLQHHHNYPYNYPDGNSNNYSDSKTFPVSSPSHISIRRKAIGKLAKVGDYRSIEPLLKIMPQVGASDKSLIFKAVTQINQRTFHPINSELFVALQNEHPEVRLNALQDLKSLYQFVSPVITQISQMQSDQDYEVRQTATQVLRQLNASPLPTFNNCSEDDDLIVGKESDSNLHLVAYLLAELDAER
jgi:hypothetical protein